jgi:hypothetical protein
MKSEDVDEHVVRALARIAGVVIPDEDLAPLIAALRSHLAGMEALEALDVDGYDPIVTFDPRWR